MSAGLTKITVGVCGGIAAYKSVELVRLLQEAGYDPHVVMTKAAEEFVRPLTFAAISGHKVITTLWGEDGGVVAEDEGSSVEHIHEAQTTKLLIVAPATADTLAKFAHGLADDFLSTMFLATTAPVIVAPAMNVKMWEHPAVRANVETLRERGVKVIEPGSGYLACGMVGGGRLAEPATIVAAVASVLGEGAAFGDASGNGREVSTEEREQDFAGETVLVTAGGTREAIDPVRFIGNRSSGRMGYAVAEAARRRGARVILITASTGLVCPVGVEVMQVVSAEDMSRAVMQRLREATIVVMAAAVSDYRVRSVAAQKIKRESARAVLLELEATEDILREVVTQRVVGTIVVGFAAETQDALANGRAKLVSKGVDAVVVNDVSVDGIGFDAEQNAGSFLTRSGAVELPQMSKTAMADRILDEVGKLRG
ncbi:MAG: bifunctional phosphopantothenoylcysteine decarboxylase/phosphopantothenate--cysteine ligase CoaBC [Edaphobacter sp.]